MSGIHAGNAHASDVVWLEFDPQSGHEQAGHRPELVIGPACKVSASADA